MRGPVRDVITDPEYIDVTLPPRAKYSHPMRRGYTAFAYVIEGRGLFEPNSDPFGYDVEGSGWYKIEREKAIGPENLVLFDDGDEILVTAGPGRLRFLLVSGKPIGEPVAWRGPVVMNTPEELKIAFDEYEQGTFLKHAKK